MTQVIGGGVFIHWNLFGTGDTLASKIAESFQGAASNLEVSVALLPRGDPARVLAPRESHRAVDRLASRPSARDKSRRARVSAQGLTGPGLRLDRLPRRQRVNRLMEGLAWLAAAIAIAFLVLIVWSVARKGASELNLDLLTKDPAVTFLSTAKEGLANAFAGTLVIVGIAIAMALPVGILVAVYLNEFAPGVDPERRQPGARRPQRRAGDRDRHLRLRAVRPRAWPERPRRLVRAGVPDAAPRRARDDGGARARPELAARGRPRARYPAVADDAQHRAPADDRRHRHRHRARGRARGG